MGATTYTAAIATASDVVAGDFCDVSVIENDVQGNLTNKVILGPQELTVRTDDLDKLEKSQAEAKDLLEAAGYKVVGGWEISSNAAYALVLRPGQVTDDYTLTIVTGPQPDSVGVEFGLSGLDSTDELERWFTDNGVGSHDDTWVLVTPAEARTNVAYDIATREITVVSGPPTVTLYETNSDSVVISNGSESWSIGPVTPDLAGHFYQDAVSWLRIDWEPNEADGQTPAPTEGLTAVAECTEAEGIRTLVDSEKIGAGARSYIIEN